MSTMRKKFPCDIPHNGRTTGKPWARMSTGALHDVATATVFAVTAGSGDGYRIERVYLDGEQGPTGSPGTTTALRRWNGPSGGMAGRCPAWRLRRPLLAGGMVGACARRQVSRCVAAHG